MTLIITFQLQNSLGSLWYNHANMKNKEATR